MLIGVVMLNSPLVSVIKYSCVEGIVARITRRNVENDRVGLPFVIGIGDGLAQRTGAAIVRIGYDKVCRRLQFVGADVHVRALARAAPLIGGKMIRRTQHGIIPRINGYAAEAKRARFSWAAVARQR